MEELAQLLAMLGVASFTEAAAVLAMINSFVNEQKAAFQKSKTADVFDVIKARLNLAASFEKALAQEGLAALAALEGIKASAGRVVQLEADANAARKSAEDRDAKDVIDTAIAATRIAPANRAKAEEMYASFGLKGLKAFIDALPQGTAPTAGGPSQKPVGSGGAATSETKTLAKAMGLKPEEIVASEKHWEETQGLITEHDIKTLNQKASQPKAA